MLPTDKAERKKYAIWRGVVMYFPRTIAMMGLCSWTGNEQHNPGQDLHWDRTKSTDHEDCMMRHMLEGEAIDDDGIPHCVKVAWRANARAELILEKLAKQDKSDQEDITYMGRKIGYTVGSQALFQCPHCRQIVSQNKYETNCSRCGKAFA